MLTSVDDENGLHSRSMFHFPPFTNLPFVCPLACIGVLITTPLGEETAQHRYFQNKKEKKPLVI